MGFTLEKPTFLKREPIELSFGTSGLRGLASDMTDLECYINTKGFLKYLIGINDISIGSTVCAAGDLRPSTSRIMAAVTAAIEHLGCKVNNCGLIPTPAMAYYAMQKGQASVMITGSHIPVNRNGIKFYKHDGEVLKVDEAGILAEVAKVRRKEYSRNPNETLFDENGMFKQPGRTGPVNEEAKKTYICRYLDVFQQDCFSGKTIIIYQHSAVGRDLLVQMLEGLGAEVIPLDRSDQFVAVDTENLTPENKEFFSALADEYRDRQIFAIVSTDGDSDRPLVADEKGALYRGDVLGILARQHLKAKFAAVPISANNSIAILLEKNEVTLRYTKIGSPYVIQAMNEAIAQGETSVVGWEVNGGFLTGTDFLINGNVLKALPTRDAFLPILCVLAEATRRSMAVSELFSELPPRYTDAGVIDNFPPDIGQKIMKHFSLPEEADIVQVEFKDGVIKAGDISKEKQTLVPGSPIYKTLLNNKAELERLFSSKPGFDNITVIDYLDGIRITFANNDIAHLRPSGNAPQFRIYANANSQERTGEIIRLCMAEPDGIIRQMQKDLAK